MPTDATHTRLIVILGPTAGGKSEFAVALAERLAPTPTQIINADSMQVYRGMDAGTAKPSPALRARVPHHLIDVADPTDRFTVADWLQQAEATIQNLQNRGTHPIVVGGTNLYIKALLEGLFDGPPADMTYRATLNDLQPHLLHQQLQDVDPASAGRIHPNDRKKLVRALEVHHLTGRPISDWQSQWSEQRDPTTENNDQQPTRYRHNPIIIGLEWPTEDINPRINRRVKQMFDPTSTRPDPHPNPNPEKNPHPLATPPTPQGLVDEVRNLLRENRLGPQAAQAIGYQQVIRHLNGHYTLEQALEQTKIVTRRFAKSQRTWLRRYRGVQWLKAPNRTPEDLAREAATALSGCKKTA